MPVNVLVIAGPTASGKTSAAISIAERFDGEIISADSMQIYKYMDIGTAKPDIKEQNGIPHHMLDIVNPWEEYSVAQYAENARAAIKDVIKRGKLPIVAGGTGLYINTLVENIQYNVSEDIDQSEVKTLEEYYEKNGAEALHNILKHEDPVASAQIHCNNVKRVIRAIGMKRTTGMTLEERNAASRANPSEFNFNVYAIDTPRDVLYDRINSRADKMIELGLVEEVQSVINLCENAYNHGDAQEKTLSKTALQAIGYKEIISYLNKEHDFDTAVERIKQGSRNYAKRQLTWFRKPSWVKWIGLEELRCKEILAD